ncbi:MAG: hypothetical protein MHM6MM_001412 [Cercozoa sp. M6MM]
MERNWRPGLRRSVPWHLFADEDQNVISTQKVHIRVQKRTSRKSVTIVEGLASDLDLKKILRFLKKIYSTNGNIATNEQSGSVLQMQGDMRQNVLDFLTQFNICKPEEVIVHGF